MMENTNIMDVLSKKTKGEIASFVTNSFLSVDEEKRKEFEMIITKVIIEAMTNPQIRKN
jgi:hypothetical protein